MERYHPHGIIPFTAGLAMHSPQWKAAYGPGLPAFVVDGVLHLLPGFRDVIQVAVARCQRL